MPRNINDEVQCSKKKSKKGKKNNKLKKKWINNERVGEFWRTVNERMHEDFEETLYLWEFIVLCNNWCILQEERVSIVVDGYGKCQRVDEMDLNLAKILNI